MNKLWLGLLFFTTFGLGASGATAQDARGAVDLALCLDTSGSMSGPLDAARMQLWEIVNELALLEPTPRLRVALLSYGNPTNTAAQGWVKVEIPLTENLDDVSERLFELTSDGGTEYVARAVNVAVQELDWAESDNALKLILVAGNEDADQDPELRPEVASEEANRLDIMVNAIFFGSANGEAADTWREMTDLGGGQFSTFNPSQNASDVVTPFDIDLTDLGASLNETSIPLGRAGEEALEAQIEQDHRAKELGSAAAANRVQTKAGALYKRDWDLVDLVESGKTVLDDVDETQLPGFMQRMTWPERHDFVDEMMFKRSELRQSIAELVAQRNQYIADHAEALGLGDSAGLVDAVRGAIRTRAEERGYNFSSR